jgi:hypothetical protein
VKEKSFIMHDVKKKIPLVCPSCEGSLQVASLRCGACGTEVSGRYDLPALARLPEKDRQFVLAFVKASGSLKDMAKQLNVSYPTVRNRLDDLIEKLKKMEEL